MSMVTTWRSDVYHLLFMCHVHIKIKFLSSECLLRYFLDFFIGGDDKTNNWWRWGLSCPSSYLSTTSWRRSGAKAILCALKLGARWQRVVSFTPWPFFSIEIFWYPIEHEVGWAPETIWMLWRRGNLASDGNWTKVSMSCLLLFNQSLVKVQPRDQLHLTARIVHNLVQRRKLWTE